MVAAHLAEIFRGLMQYRKGIDHRKRVKFRAFDEIQKERHKTQKEGVELGRKVDSGAEL